MVKSSFSTAGLYRKIVFPVTLIIIALVLVFTVISGYIIASIQNAQAMKAVEQSMNYAYRNLWYQLSGMKTIIGFVNSNQEIENILDKKYASKDAAVSDYFALFTQFQNLSLMSLLNEIDPSTQAQIYYTISVVLAPGNGLYGLATSNYAAVNGVYKNDDVVSKPWFCKLGKGDPMVWWAESDASGDHIYAAKRKLSSRDGSEQGIVAVGYDIRNIKGILKQNGFKDGYYILADESNKVVYSNKFAFGHDMGGETYIREVSGDRQGIFLHKGEREQKIIAYSGFDNGWKLISIVPESSLNDYKGPIAGIAAVVGVIAILAAGLLIRRIAAKVTRPIERLARLMKRVEAGEFHPPAPMGPTSIEEVDLLYRGYSSMLRKLNEMIEEVYVKNITQKQLQLDLLQSQINPHFLYNTLDIINCKALSMDVQDISLITRSLANVLRYGLNKGRQSILLKDELKQVSGYLEIQRIMHNSLSFEITADESLGNAGVIHFILQPLVENSIVHGFKNKRKDRHIAVHASQAGGDIRIEVRDNGCGVDPDRMNRVLADPDSDSGEGFGTRNVDRRIKLYFGARYGLHYVSVDEGTCVAVSLPLQESLLDQSGKLFNETP